MTTAAGSTYTLTLTNSAIKGSELIAANVYTGGTGTPQIVNVTPSAGQLVIVVKNIHASAAFNNTLSITYAAFAP